MECEWTASAWKFSCMLVDREVLKAGSNNKRSFLW